MHEQLRMTASLGKRLLDTDDMPHSVRMHAGKVFRSVELNGGGIVLRTSI